MTTMNAKGYLAFPAGFTMTAEHKLRSVEESLSRLNLSNSTPSIDSKLGNQKEQQAECESARTAHTKAWAARTAQEDERRRVREEDERAEALRGEIAWVRSGGILRSADGRRDYARTEEVRRVVAEEDRQRAVLERWRAYEEAWARLLNPTQPSSNDSLLRFSDIPWPTVKQPKSVGDLRESGTSIEEFLFESLSIRANVTRRERIRTSLLRWHPDKLGSVLATVHEEDRAAVKDGFDVVAMCLMHLQTNATQSKP